jgi:hypothetical protein
MEVVGLVAAYTIWTVLIGVVLMFVHSNFFCQQMHSLLKYKMLQLTFKISLCWLLHVSVRSDHHQGAMPNLAKVAVFVELSLKIHR